MSHKSPNKYGVKRALAVSGSQNNLGGQIEYANEVFKDAAILQ